MTPKERTAIRSRLNKQRNRLKKKGASPVEMQQYFGLPNAVKFGDLDDHKLKSISDLVKSRPVVTVLEGHIYPTKYIRHHNEWFKGNTTPKVSDFYRSLLSPLMKDKNIKSVRARKAEFDQKVRGNYIAAIEDLGLSHAADVLSKMPDKDFWKFVQASGGAIGYEVFVTTNLDEGQSHTRDSIRQASIDSLNSLILRYEKETADRFKA